MLAVCRMVSPEEFSLRYNREFVKWHVNRALKGRQRISGPLVFQMKMKINTLLSPNIIPYVHYFKTATGQKYKLTNMSAGGRYQNCDLLCFF